MGHLPPRLTVELQCPYCQAKQSAWADEEKHVCTECGKAWAVGQIQPEDRIRNK